MKIEIKHRRTNAVIFAHDVKENTIVITVLAALVAGANLSCADLSGTNLLV
jgi:hypothetical protein